MIQLTMPYKSHSNKSIWDFATQLCNQNNNVGLSSNLSELESLVNTDNFIYLVFDYKTEVSYNLYLYIALSQMSNINNDFYVYNDVWLPLCDVTLNVTDNLPIYQDCYIFSLDIKKYNSILSFTKTYQNRNNISLYLDRVTSADIRNVLYKVSDDEYVNLSPSSDNLNNKSKNHIETSLHYSYRNNTNKTMLPQLTIEGVDKNSFLLPFMAYRDFLNFAVYSTDTISYITKKDNKLSFINQLRIDEKLKFYLKLYLRQDKFIANTDNFKVATGLWQLIVLLQGYKSWCKLDYYSNYTASLYLNPDCCVTFIFYDNNKNIVTEYNDNMEPDIDTYRLVGKLHSDELFKINKLYSNASRVCYFDFSTQTFVGNNYIFNNDKSKIETIHLENKVNAELPLKMTLTELKHFLGADLSQKNFMLYVYTDGIRVMLERYNTTKNSLDCRIIFDHNMSKSNQKLTI